MIVLSYPVFLSCAPNMPLGCVWNSRKTNAVFGTQEIQEREIAKRESGKRDGFSHVWSIREIAERDHISWGPPTFYFSSLLRRKWNNTVNSKTVLPFYYFSRLVL
jgi:hypothetical protein